MPSTPELSDVRRSILSLIKRYRALTIADLAKELEISYEAVRQQISGMRAAGWLERETIRSSGRPAGRPQARYALTSSGEHLFPKYYDMLSIELIDAIVEQSGRDGLKAILASLATARVERWAPQMEGLSLKQRLEALKSVYLAEDPFMETEQSPSGELRLIERNCPFFDVARQRPALCSLTISVLEQLLGFEVVREERFQNGDGRCVFRVLTHRPIQAPAFRFEAS